MRRVLSSVVALSWAVGSYATGLDHQACGRYQLSRPEIVRIEKKLKKIPDQRLDRTRLHACVFDGLIVAFVTSVRRTEPDTSEYWYEGSCETRKGSGYAWSCEGIGFRALQIHWPGAILDPVDVYIPFGSDARLARRRFEEILPLLSQIDERHACHSGENTAQEFLELKSDLQLPAGTINIEDASRSFALRVLRYSVGFTVDGDANSEVRLGCWRKRENERALPETHMSRMPDVDSLP